MLGDILVILMADDTASGGKLATLIHCIARKRHMQSSILRNVLCRVLHSNLFATYKITLKRKHVIINISALDKFFE